MILRNLKKILRLPRSEAALIKAYVTLAMYAGAIDGFIEYDSAKGEDAIPFPKRLSISSQVIGYGALKGLQYVTFPITWPLSQPPLNKISFFNKSTKDFANQTCTEFRSRINFYSK